MADLHSEESQAKARATKQLKGPRKSLRKAINDKCKECIYDPKSGNGHWRQQVEACTSFQCPLFPVRPVSTEEKINQEELSCENV